MPSKVWQMALQISQKRVGLGNFWVCPFFEAQDLRLYPLWISFGSTSRGQEKANFDFFTVIPFLCSFNRVSNLHVVTSGVSHQAALLRRKNWRCSFEWRKRSHWIHVNDLMSTVMLKNVKGNVTLEYNVSFLLCAVWPLTLSWHRCCDIQKFCRKLWSISMMVT